MFKIATTETYTAPVSVELPGEKTKRTFEVEFKRLPKDGIKALFDRATAGEIDDEAFCREVVMGWRGIADEGGDALDFTPSHFDQLLTIFPVAASIVTAYTQSLNGARLKN